MKPKLVLFAAKCGKPLRRPSRGSGGRKDVEGWSGFDEVTGLGVDIAGGVEGEICAQIMYKNEAMTRHESSSTNGWIGGSVVGENWR